MPRRGNEPGIPESLQHLLGLIQALLAEEWPREAGVGAAPSQQGMVGTGSAKALAQLLGQHSVTTAPPQASGNGPVPGSLPEVKLQHQDSHSHLKVKGSITIGT